MARQNPSFNICRTEGHNIASLPINPVYNPKSNMLIPQAITVCTKCGQTLKEIQNPLRSLPKTTDDVGQEPGNATA